MDKEKELNKRSVFPKKAMIVFLIIFTAAMIYDMQGFIRDFMLSLNTTSLFVGFLIVLFIGGFSTLMGLVASGFWYALTKLPTQWISKEKDVYKNDIWAAIFYSNSLSLIIGILIDLFNLQGNTIVSIVINIFITGLFLAVYFSGVEKEKHIKRAITIVEVSWLILGAALSVYLSMTDFGFVI